MFWIGLSDDKNDGRGIRLRTVRKAIPPVFGDQPSSGEAVDIGRKRKRYHIGGQPVGNRSGLTRRATVRLLDTDATSGFGFIFRDEFGIDLLVDLTGWVVGNVEQPAVPFAMVVLE